MNRREMIENAAIELAGRKLELAVKHITEHYKANRDKIDNDFLQETANGLQLCMQAPKKIGYIAISLLESSLITKTYDLQIAFYSKDLYADRKPVYKYWAPVFIYEYLDSDIEEIQEVLKRQIIRLKSYEVYELKRQYAANLYFLIGFLMKGLVPHIADLQSFQEVDKEKSVKILFGKYMEKQIEMITLGA